LSTAYEIIIEKLSRNIKHGFNFLAPIAVKILLRRGSAQKIATDSGKKLQKNNIKRKRYNQKLRQEPP